MKYDRSKNPAEFATPKYVFPEVGLDSVNGLPYLFSTDGRAAILVEVEAEPYEIETLFHRTIPAPVFDRARSNLSAPLTVEGDAVTVGPMSYRTSERGPIPSISNLLRDLTKSDQLQGFDAALMARIQKALGASGVLIQFHGPREPIIVHGVYGKKSRGRDDSSFGLLMPFA